MMVTQCKWGPCSHNAKYSPAGINLCPRHLNEVLEHVHRLDQNDQDVRWVLTPKRTPTNNDSKPLASPRSETRQRVYFMEREGLVKIGISSNVPKRVQEVSRGSSMISGMTVGPVRLIGTRPGGRDEESRLHKLFKAARVGGEWFRLSEDQMLKVEQMCK
jgi:hypothetical protein